MEIYLYSMHLRKRGGRGIISSRYKYFIHSGKIINMPRTTPQESDNQIGSGQFTFLLTPCHLLHAPLLIIIIICAAYHHHHDDEGIPGYLLLSIVSFFFSLVFIVFNHPITPIIRRILLMLSDGMEFRASVWVVNDSFHVSR